MGNQMSVPLRPEDQQNESEADTYKVMSGSECVQNGNPVIVSTHTVQHYDEVDLGISIPKDNAATSSSKTMEPNAVANASGKNLGRDANPEAPAARSRFFLTLSRSVPGRPADQGTDSLAASGKLDVSPSTEPVNKDLCEHKALPVAAAPGQAADKTSAWTQTEDQALPTTSSALTPELGAETPSRPKDLSFFDRIFKLDKGREKVPVDSQQQEGKRPDDPDNQDKAAEAPVESANSHGVPEGEDTVVSEEREGQEVETLSCSITGDPEALETPKEDLPAADTTDNNNSIMSFFKTLVSPNKTETKNDPEDKNTENSPTTSANVKSDKANFTPQETQGASKSSKGCSPPGQVPPATASDTGKEGVKEKSGPASLPLGKLFWKKSVKEDSVSTGAEENAVCESPVETKNFEEVESALQTVDLSEEDGRPEPADVKVKEESKPRRTPLMAFLRQMSVKGNRGITHSEEINEKDSSGQTSNSTEKVPTPPESTGTAQKAKESSSKDKKSVAEVSKQKSSKADAREPAQCAQPGPVEASSLQNGDQPPKRAERRRQSLGGFLKGLGPKRMLDAQVQTDPVSIGPAGKSK